MAVSTFDIIVLSSSSPRGQEEAATAELSPPSPYKQRVTMAAISPLSLSPAATPSRKDRGTSTLRSGSRAAPIPAKASRGFATARSILDIDDEIVLVQEALGPRLSIEEQADTGEAVKASVAEPNLERPRPQPRTKRPTTGKPDATTRDAAPRKRTSKRPPPTNPNTPKGGATRFANVEEIQDSEDDAALSPTPPRAHKAKDSAQLSLGSNITSSHFTKCAAVDVVDLSGDAIVHTKRTNPHKKSLPAEGIDKQPAKRMPRVSKPKASTKRSTKPRRKATDLVSAHFADLKASRATGTGGDSKTSDGGMQDSVGAPDAVLANPVASKSGPSKQRRRKNHDPLALDEAVTRKRGWTPPLDTTASLSSANPDGKENHPTVAEADQQSFTSLLSGYSYPHPILPSATTSISTCSDEQSVTKLRRVEASPPSQPDMAALTDVAC